MLGLSQTVLSPDKPQVCQNADVLGVQPASTMVCPHLHNFSHSCLFCKYCIYIESIAKRASALTPPCDDRTRRAQHGPPGFSDACKHLGPDFELLSATKPNKLEEPIKGVKKVADS